MKLLMVSLLGLLMFTACGDDVGLEELTLEDTTLSKARISSDNSKIVVNYRKDSQDQIAIMNRDGSDINILMVEASYLSAPTWSDDGAKIIVNGDGIRRMNIDGTEDELLVDAFAATEPDISRDGKKLTWGVNGGSLNIMDLETKEVTRLELTGGSPRFSPDGSKIAFSDGTAIRLMNSDGTGVENIISGELSYLTSVSWLPDGKRLAITSSRGVELVDIDEKSRKTIADGFATKDIDVSPDGSLLVYGINGQTGLSFLTNF